MEPDYKTLHQYKAILQQSFAFVHPCGADIVFDLFLV